MHETPDEPASNARGGCAAPAGRRGIHVFHGEDLIVLRICAWLTLIGLPFTALSCGARPPGSATALPEQAAGVRLVMDQADAALSILETAPPVPESLWTSLWNAEGYRRLHQREAAMGRAFSDESFREFLLGDSLRARAPALRSTVDAWRQADIRAAANRALMYLPPGSSLRARLYPVIKPRVNSFVFELNTDSAAIFMYVDPAVSRAKFENTLAHELHHVGYAAACAADAQATDGVGSVRRWSGAFGEGLALLAAAGSADTHPHTVSDPAERAVWDRDYANVGADLERIEGFFVDVLEGRITGSDVQQRAMTFFGDAQGPWYTVGYLMASTVERAHGRAALVATICSPPALMRAYNAAAMRSNAEAGTRLPLWSAHLLDAIGG
jgi:hypothetical protein